jgi:Leucine-rich repeat (LRR) protein
MLNRLHFLKFAAFMLAIELLITTPLSTHTIYAAENNSPESKPVQADAFIKLVNAPLAVGFCDGVSEILTPECQALVALYNSTDGAHWTDHTNWLVTSTPCDWIYVICDTGHVVHLYLGNNHLSGTIPSELKDLTSLQDLYLGSNNLTGSIPPELGNLSNLLNLDLFGNHLTGSIPKELGSLSNLVSLSVGSNTLTGIIHN